MRINLGGESKISVGFQLILGILVFTFVLGGCFLMSHTKDNKYFQLLYVSLGILVFLEFKKSIDVIKTMDLLTDIFVWLIIAVPTIYFVIKKDVRKLAMVLIIPVIFILIGFISTFESLINNI
jgi:hypothetical protein